MFDLTNLEVPLDAPRLGSAGSPALVCVCCNCDRIRIRSGEWSDHHSLVAGERRTHGICPECFVALYPEYDYLSEARAK